MDPPDPSDPDANSMRSDAADALRGQAATCRRLAVRALTAAGSTALGLLGEHFDDQARRIDPNSERR